MDIKVRKIMAILKTPPVAKTLMVSNTEEAVSILKKHYNLVLAFEEWNEIKEGILAGEIRPSKVSFSMIERQSRKYRVGFVVGKVCKIAFFLMLIFFLAKFIFR